MIALRTSALAVLLACSLAALAQTASPQPIERQMSPEQFKAAGLDKLSPVELANLNTWLNRAITVETTRAAANAKKKVEEDNRGFFNFGSVEPIVGRINGEFRGFEKGRTYTLENGHVWKQIDEATLAGVRKTNPQIKITPSMVGNAWYLSIEGYNSRAKVQRIK